MKVAYIRVSTQEQNTIRQEEIMKNYNIEKVFIDKMSGVSKERPQLKEMINYVRENDIVIVESISRFARNTKDLLDLIEELNKKKVTFISQKESIDTSTPSGKFMLTIFGAVAELEREYIKIRQQEGIQIAIKEGRFNGRPKKEIENFDYVIELWENKKISATVACKKLKISRATFYRRINSKKISVNNK